MLNLQESHTHDQAKDRLLMPGIYDGFELKSWQRLEGTIVGSTGCADEGVGKYVKPFFFERRSGTYTITDVTVPLKGRNKLRQFSARHRIKLSSNLMFNLHKNKYLEAHVLENKCVPWNIINGMRKWLASLQTQICPFTKVRIVLLLTLELLDGQQRLLHYS